MGSAMCWPARDNGHAVRLVGTPLDREIIETARKTGVHPGLKRKLPDGVELFQIEELETALAGAELVISGVSSFGAQWFEEYVIPRLPDASRVLFVTKGLEAQPDGTLLPFPVAMSRRLPAGRNLSLNGIGGPCLCYELCDRYDTTVAFCGEDMENLRRLRGMLETAHYHVPITTDIMGAECAVAMKNGFALGVALAIGEKAAHGVENLNPESALFGEATRETLRLIRLMGGDSESICYFTGDLYVTVQAGRSRRLGELLGRGYDIDEAREKLAGVTLESAVVIVTVAAALRKMEQRGIAKVSDFPLLMHIDGLLRKTETLNLPWREMARQ
jgi:glycerol-3-phosphate dehydrogenase (NAD(P)+)